jgi:hypothetical protein
MDRIENEKIRSNTQTLRQQGDLISLLTEIRGEYTDRRTDRQVISLASFNFFKISEVR